MDVTNSNNGKITWNYIKPIIQGKFLYGPINPQTKQIIQNVNVYLLNNSKFEFHFPNFIRGFRCR